MMRRLRTTLALTLATAAFAVGGAVAPAEAKPPVPGKTEADCTATPPAKAVWVINTATGEFSCTIIGSKTQTSTTCDKDGKNCKTITVDNPRRLPGAASGTSATAKPATQAK